ncbi:MAG: hypothetical protein JWQ03_142 [Variovorax sp.]|nr:hypothetical protein [Variovorax sp.]
MQMPHTHSSATWSPYRALLIATLTVIAIAQVIAMAMVTSSQVKAARQRESLQATSRAVAARCFESTSTRAMDMCVASGTPRQVTEVVDNSDTYAAHGQGQRAASGLMPVGFASIR